MTWRGATGRLEHWTDQVLVYAGRTPGETTVPERFKRAAVAYVALVAAGAAVAGLFVHGQRGFLIAWVYVGGVLITPALLITWMVARRELESTAGGRWWALGLVSMYVVGALLLLVANDPGSWLESVSVPVILPTIVLFGGAALQAVGGDPPSRHRREAHIASGLTLVALTALVTGFLAPRVDGLEAGWLAVPAAMVGVILVAAAVLLGWRPRDGMHDAVAFNRIGLALLVVGALNAFGLVAQALTGFALHSSALLVVQAVCMGLFLLMPLYVGREASSPATSWTRDLTSRAWFAEDPAEESVLPARLRPLAVGYLAVTLPVVAGIGLFVEGQSAFLLAWVYVSGLYTTPAMIVTWAAAKRTQHLAEAWRLWFYGLVALYLNGAALVMITVSPNDFFENLAIVTIAPCVALFGAAAIRMMRARSGDRALSVDIVETAIVQTVVLATAALVVGDGILTSDAAWFAIPTFVVAVAVTTGLVWMMILYRRVTPANRTLETLGLLVALVGSVDAWAMVAQSLSGFTLPSAPLLVLQATAMGLLLLLPLYVPRLAPEGLERLPPQAQVRKGWAVVGLTSVAVPLLFVGALLSRERLPWAPTGFAVIVTVLLGLASVRQLLAISETRRLYAQVAEAADERRRVLADVMRSVDEDRHRVASQLHEQALASYAAFCSMTRSPASGAGTGGSTILAGVSARLRDDLAEQAESLRQLMLAVRPLEAAGPVAHRLATPIHAYVVNLYGDGRAPEVRVAVDDDICLDWTTETVVLRIVQEALGNVWRHAAAGEITVSLTVEDNRLLVTVADDGCGFDDERADDGSGLATMRSFATLVDGDLRVESVPGQGTVVQLRCGSVPPSNGPAPVQTSSVASPPMPSKVPRLSLVRDH